MTDLASKNSTKMRWQGAGAWNVYFILKFVFASLGYLNLNLFYNALLLAGVVLPIKHRLLSVFRTIVAMAAGGALLYSESWLPSLESIMANAGNIADFSLVYLLEVAVDSINWTLLGSIFLASVIYLFVKDWIRVTAITTIYLTWLVVQPYCQSLQAPTVITKEVAQVEDSSMTLMGPHQTGTSDTASIDRWLESFYIHEASRQTQFPKEIAQGVPFDVLLVNICSLSQDDLAVAKLTEHPVLARFDIYLDNFNSATAYSGPATLRLLSASCGQSSHSALYDNRRPTCELMTNLSHLGYSQHLFMDHEGKFDNYLPNLKSVAGMQADLASQKGYRPRYTGFDGDVVYDDADLFKHWLKTVSDDTTQRTVTLFNLIALHDGNRSVGSTRAMPFGPRAKLMLDQLHQLMNDIEKSGRRVMMVVVPEHGAAVRGDKIQMARLRDIPSPHITHVPTMVKYFGLQGDVNPVRVKENTSYLAVSEMIARTLDIDLYRQADANATVQGIARGLPQTYPVSENSNAAVVRFQNKYFVRLNGGEWLPYM